MRATLPPPGRARGGGEAAGTAERFRLRKLQGETTKKKPPSTPWLAFGLAATTDEGARVREHLHGRNKKLAPRGGKDGAVARWGRACVRTRAGRSVTDDGPGEERRPIRRSIENSAEVVWRGARVRTRAPPGGRHARPSPAAALHAPQPPTAARRRLLSRCVPAVASAAHMHMPPLPIPRVLHATARR